MSKADELANFRAGERMVEVGRALMSAAAAVLDKLPTPTGAEAEASPPIERWPRTKNLSLRGIPRGSASNYMINWALDLADRVADLNDRLQALVSHLEQRHGLDLPPTTESPMRDSPSAAEPSTWAPSTMAAQGIVPEPDLTAALPCPTCGLTHRYLACKAAQETDLPLEERVSFAREKGSATASIAPAIPSSSPSGQRTIPIFRAGPGCECAPNRLLVVEMWEPPAEARCPSCGAVWFYLEVIPAPAAPQSETGVESE